MATYKKSDLIKELVKKTGVKRKEAIALLNVLFEIACRETKKNGFTFTGLFKIDMTSRKERRMRNPRTGQAILITEHMAPRIRILKKARDIIIEDEPKQVIPLDDPTAPEKKAPAPTPAAPAFKPEASNLEQTAPASTHVDVPLDKPKTTIEKQAEADTSEKEQPTHVVYDDFSEAVSFKCQSCGGEIEAPAAAAGFSSNCPVCGKTIVIPSESEPGTIHAPKPDLASLDDQVEAAAEKAFSEASLADQKNQTIRIDLSTLDVNAAEAPKAKQRIVSFFCKKCKQELEAPAEMMGMKSACPDCGTGFEVPFFSDPGTLHGSDLDQADVGKGNKMHNRTIRIEMPDF